MKEVVNKTGLEKSMTVDVVWVKEINQKGENAVPKKMKGSMKL